MTKFHVEPGVLVLDEKGSFYSHIHSIGDKYDHEDGLIFCLTKGVLVAYGVTENKNPLLLMKKYDNNSEEPRIVGVKVELLSTPIDLKTAHKESLEQLGINLYDGFIPIELEE